MPLDRELVAIGAPRLLVLRALGLGDLLTAVPALRGIGRAFPEHHRILATPRSLAPLLDLIRCSDGSPAIHELLDVSLLAPSALAGASLAGTGTRGGRTAMAVNLHGRGPQSHRLLLSARPERLVAFAHPQVPECATGPRWRDNEHETRRWCRMLQESGVECDPTDLEIERPHVSVPGARGATPNAHGAAADVALPEARRGEAHGATVIHPGASSPARRWPVRRWAAVAAAERIVGRRVLLTGSPSEEPLCRAVAEGAGLPERAVLAGRTTVAELAGVVANVGRVVCGDTGVAHLATALGTPSVVLFGPVPPAEWGPPAGRPIHRALWAGSTGDPHARRPDPGLLRITVGDVLDELEALERATRC